MDAPTRHIKSAEEAPPELVGPTLAPAQPTPVEPNLAEPTRAKTTPAETNKAHVDSTPAQPNTVKPKTADKATPQHAAPAKPPARVEKAPTASELKEPAPLNIAVSPEQEIPVREPARLEQPPVSKAPTAKKEPAPVKQDPVPKTEVAPQKEPQKKEPRAEAAPPVAKEPPPPLPRNLQVLRSRLRTVLSYYYRQPLNSQEYDPWEVMHSMLSYELHSRVRDGGPRGEPITAVGYLCFNMPCERKQMLYINDSGEVDVRVGVGLQGHKGQLLAMLAQCNVSPEYPIRVNDQDFTIHDLIRTEQHTCYAKSELTFKLIGLGHYLESDATWVNDQGESWDIPRLIREERTQPIRGAACGGTHRLSGLSLAYQRREARGEPIDGEYLEAKNFVHQYQQYAFRLQNRDGSFSTEWFRGRGEEEDIERRIRTSGHTLEWLIYSLPDDELRSRNVVRGVAYLTNLLANYGKQDWHKGSLGHALHALVLYDKRVFQPLDDQDSAAEQVAEEVNVKANKYRGYALYRGVMRGNSQPEEQPYFGLFGGPRRR